MISSRHIDTVPVTLYAISKALAGRFVARTELSPVAVCGAPQAAFLRAAGVTARGCGGFAPPPGPRSAFRFSRGLGLAPDWRKARRRVFRRSVFRLGPRRRVPDRPDRACSYWPNGGYYDTPHWVLCALCPPCRTCIFYCCIEIYLIKKA